MVVFHRFHSRKLGVLRAVTFTLLAAILLGVSAAARTHAQTPDLVASLEVLNGTVEVQRVAVSDWVKIDKETLIGVGDSVRTDATGDTRITFFANGTDTEVLPNSQLRIDDFTGSGADQYQLSVTVVLGQTTQRINTLLDNGSSYTINTTGIQMAIRGTVLAVRVEPSGRGSTLVEKGLVKTTGVGNGAPQADVPAGYGVRGVPNKGLSDVVKATSFAALDAALDGCPGLIDPPGDVSLNVRTGPSLLFPVVGLVDDDSPTQLMGVTDTTGWYRLAFSGGYGWVNLPNYVVSPTCGGLRHYADTFGPENTALYTGLPAGIDLHSTSTPTATPTR